MKKVFLAVTFLVLVFSLILSAACGGGAQPTATPKPAAPKAQATAAPAAAAATPTAAPAAAKPTAAATQPPAAAKPKAAAEPTPIPGVKMPRFLTLAAGSNPGSLINFSTMTLAHNIEATFPDTKVRLVPSGSKEAIVRLDAGDFQLSYGIDDSVWGWFGVKRAGWEKPVQSFRTLYTNPPIGGGVFLVVLADSDIYSFKDMYNKRVTFGVAGFSFVRIAIPQIMKLYGISYDSIRKNGGFVYYADAANGMEMLTEGRLDVVLTSTIHPWAPLTQAMMFKKLRFIPLNKQEIEAWTDPVWGHPVYMESFLPAGTYPGQDKDLATVMYPFPVIARADMPDDVVYNIMVAQWGQGRYKKMGDLHPAVKNVDFLGQVNKKLFIPLHPGAKRFWDDMGIQFPKSVVESITYPPEALQ